MDTAALELTARSIVADGKGILSRARCNAAAALGKYSVAAEAA